MAGVTACSDDGTEPVDAETVLLDVIPPGGATDVDPNGPIVVEFNHPIGWGMAEYAVLHEGSLDGPAVDGVWELSDDRTTLTFTPAEPLKPLTEYTIHLGGGMVDHQGQHVNLERHGFQFGGEWCTGEQFGQGGMGPMGPMGPHHGQGPGWQGPNGHFGMTFTFTTGA